MTIIIYGCTFLLVFSISYFLLPLVLKLFMANTLKELPNRFGQKIQDDISDALKKKRDSMVPELKNQVIAHLVEPWLGRFAEKCTRFVATNSSEKLISRYSDVIFESFAKKRLVFSILLGQLSAFCVVSGYYLHGFLH